MTRNSTILWVILAVLIAGYAFSHYGSQNPSSTNSPSATPTVSSATQRVQQMSQPVLGGVSRVTKKPFGIYITPASSPVQPEKFTGYHTGADFETFANEANSDVTVYVACDGKLLEATTAGGYGGVAVESCILDGQPVTVVYGHIKLASVAYNVGNQMKAGRVLAVLGKGYSTETDGERKHLHFAIHKGTAINILGYVQNKGDLAGWVNPIDYLQ